MKNRLVSIFFFGITVLFGSAQLYSQDTIDPDGPANQGTLTKHFTSKADPAFIITLGALGLGESNQWGYCVGATDCGGSYTDVSITGSTDIDVLATEGGSDFLTATFNGSTITISHPATGAPEAELYILRLKASITSPTDPREVVKQYHLRVRDPLRMAFVVDRSGSMECVPDSPVATSNWDACANMSNANNKWNQVKSGLNLFLTPLTSDTDKQVPGDVFSIVYFDGDTIDVPAILGPMVDDSPATTAIPPFVDLSTFTSNIAADFDAVAGLSNTGRNGTGLGTGVAYALDKKHDNRADSPDFRQIMIVITDGQQNRLPMVMESGANLGKQLNDGTSLLNTTTTGADYIDYYLLGLDADHHAGSYGNLLQEMSTEMGNFVHVSPTKSVTQAVNELIAQVYAGYSPQIIDVEELSMTNTQVEHVFPVNNFGEALYFTASFRSNRAAGFSYRLEKDGEDKTGFLQTDNPVFEGNSALLMVDVDRLREAGEDLKGDWKLIIRRIIGVDRSKAVQQVVVPQLTVSAIIDDELINLAYSLGQASFEVGDKMRPQLEFTIDGTPVTNASISATIIRPGADKGDLLARANVPHTPESLSEINNAFSVKYANIRSLDPDYLAPLALQSNVINLAHRGNGRYEGLYDRLDVTGNYSIVFRVEADHPVLGRIVRYKRLSSAVRFGELDHNLANQTLTSGKGDNGYYFNLKYTPSYTVNGQTRLVGPGYENSFSVKGSGETSLDNVVDNGDGTYTLQVSSDQRNPKTTFYLADEPFYVDRGIQGFDDVYLPYKWHVSVHGGATLPLDTLEAQYGGSFFAEIDLGVALAPRWEAELIGGYYAFDSGFSVWGGSLNARYNLLQLGANNLSGFTASVGAGVYQPESESATFGWNGRLGLQRQLTPKISLSVEGAYFHLPDPDYRWGTLGVAARFGL